MTFTISVRNKEKYFDSIEVLDPYTYANKKRVVKQLTEFCMSKFKQSDEEIISELLKQKPNEMITNTCDLLQQWVNHFSKKLSPRSLVIYLSNLRTYLNYRGIKLSTTDMKSLNLPRQIIEEKYPLSKDEIKQILDNCKYRRKVLYLTLSSSLMRIGEACQLRKKDFDTTTNRITIHIPAQVAKFKKSRITFASDEARPYLMKRLNEIEDNDLVFGTNENKQLAKQNEIYSFEKLIDKIFPKLEKYASRTRKITLHSFRAYGITKAVRTVSDSFACILAGQKGYLSMYKRFTDEEKLEDYLKLEPELFIFKESSLSDQSKDKEIEELKTEMSNMKTMVTSIFEVMRKEKKI